MRIFRGVAILIAVCVLAAHAQDKEAALGRVLAAEMNGRTTAIHNSRIDDYVKRLGARIAAQIPDARYPFTFRVIGDDTCPATHEPVALPGGYVYVPVALFGAAKDEAEFAGMLAHAMAHIVGARIENAGGIPVVYIGNGIGVCAERANKEFEADAEAAKVIARAGFDPEGLLRYVERVSAGGNRRIAALGAVIKQIPKADSQVTSGEFVEVRALVR